ncbi:Predicted coiled-coil protein [Phaffia rhodozyma]|uniref:Predicted coiled-coil protein n=1 Tax=Phaffia rhodozyma TaxID=264483 RepID=A0A0F7STQ0_PHARH|nr:Predicted coiled-coil protein [Phaffia rhodozyma]
MVVFFTSNVVDPPATIYMGKDKVENEDLIKYGTKEDIWFHVDKLSSAHVYLRIPSSLPYGDWDNLPEKLLIDLGQLVKANSIEGNKKNNITIIYTPWDNLKKTGDMATGAVSFHSDKRVKRVYISTRDNAIVNRLVKTKVVKEVDHEHERIERLKEEGKFKKLKANELKNAQLEASRMREAAKAAKSYDSLFTEEAGYGVQKEKKIKSSNGDESSDDDFW